MTRPHSLRELRQSLGGYFHHYRHAWLAISLLTLLIIILGQSPSEEINDAGNNSTDAVSVTAPDNVSAPLAIEPTIEPEEPATDNSTVPAQTHTENIASITTNNAPSLILIIDDIGNSLAAGMRAAALPGKVTLAVMPYTPHGSRVAEAAYSTGQEIMLHMPMSNQSGMNLGPDGLTADLDKTEITRRLHLALADVPHIRGINNHTGSELTELAEPMEWVMHELSNYPLYFIDSMTTAKSVAFDTAKRFSIPTLKRHVFLDNVRDTSAIDTQFQQALRIARQEGLAVAIGHPYEETLAYLEQALPALKEAGVELHFASELLSRS